MATAIDLNDLDLSVLDELAELKEERATLMTRLNQMDERKTEVAPTVYLRVRADYEQQRLKFEAQERPLKQSALEIYAKLRNRIDQLEREDEDAKLNLQELEFRHSLGEFDKSQFAVRKDVIDNAIQDRAADFSTAKSIKDRFLSIFGSERELELSAPTAAPAPEATVLVTPIAPPPAAAPPIPLEPPINPYTPIPQANVAAGIPGMPPVPGMPAIPEARIEPRADVKPEAKPEPRRPSSPDATVVFRPGRLIPMNPEAGIAPTMLSLKPISIGSDNSCDVRLSAPNIQRKQVDITLSRAGFMLKDVGGGGVVSIDGLPVTEQLLRDGDTVQIGAARFSFKLA